MTKMIKIATAIALASTLALAGCKKKAEETPAAKPTEGTAAGTAAAPAGGTAAPAGGTAAPAGDTAGTAAAPAGDTAAAPAADSTGVPECDAYLAAFEKLAKCDKAGPALDGLKQGLEATKQGWAAWKDLQGEALDAAKKAAAPGCKAGEDALKQTASSLGCEI
ncbi:MAG TPA: hypothetical protein VM734_27835 [Kofleriaceae bacterium]|jgi:hypothetical protein|nr:hypothetical protein [Kofleriaceae bacterium]